MTDLSGHPPQEPVYLSKDDTELQVGDVVQAVHAGTTVAGAIQALMPHQPNGPAPEIVIHVNLRIPAAAATLLAKKDAPHPLSQPGELPPLEAVAIQEQHSTPVSGPLEPTPEKAEATTSETQEEPPAAQVPDASADKTNAEPVKQAARSLKPATPAAHPPHSTPHKTPAHKPKKQTRRKPAPQKGTTA